MPVAPLGPCRRLPGAAALGVLAALLPATAAPAQEQAPRKLFPDSRPPVADDRPSAPLADPAEPPAVDGIRVGSLDPPTLAALGVRATEEELGGPLWPAGAPPELDLLLSRLPADVGEPTLRALQAALLEAPGPSSGAGKDLFLLRVDRLLAMAEPDAALELLVLVPEGSRGAEVEARRLLARLAADQVEPACGEVETRASVDPPWPRARIVCAALAGDAAAVELGLDLLDARGGEPDPVLAGLARAAVADAEDRYRLGPPVADDPALLPLIRRVPLDVDPGVVAELPLPVRRALADNPDLAAAARAASLGAPRPGPSVRAELNGRPPPSWADALASVAPGLRPSWLALADGLGLEVPEPVWAEVYRTAPGGGGNPAPDLFLWRGLEQARLQGQRGAVLLHALLLLGGRPEAAPPVALRRALDALVGLGLERPAAAVAAGTGGALGL
ncbi:MAG TPA: hypothetical protein VFY87_29460 [Geminicoccaceae bacterium]|nr:hypothetical protein [Geminicoccaceae bacterium]